MRPSITAVPILVARTAPCQHKPGRHGGTTVHDRRRPVQSKPRQARTEGGHGTSRPLPKEYLCANREKAGMSEPLQTERS